MSDDTNDQPDGKRYRPPRLPPFAILDANFYSNRKIRKAGRDGRDVFVFALTRNALRGRTGLVDATELEPDYVADMLQIDEQSAALGLERAIMANLLAPEGDQYRIVGWDEQWARVRSESEARQLRREKARGRDPESETQSEKQTQKEKRPGKARTLSGQRPDKCAWDPLSPPRTEEEDAKAWQIIHKGIGKYTGQNHSTALERNRLVYLLRQNHKLEHLIALGEYCCDGGGLGWYAKRDRDGLTYMRGNCNVTTVYSEANVAKYLGPAVSPWAREWFDYTGGQEL